MLTRSEVQKLERRTKEELVLAGSKLGIKKVRSLTKAALIEAIRQSNLDEVRSVLNLTLWQRYKWHLFGWASVIGVVATIFVSDELLDGIRRAVTGRTYGSCQLIGNEPETEIERRDRLKKTRNRDMSARENAQGICWIGCTNKGPLPMRRFDLACQIDVDSAYSRVKREFDFRSKAERLEVAPRLNGWLSSTVDFRYQETPGVSYTMRGYKHHISGSEESPNTIQIELAKSSDGETAISVSYYADNIRDIADYEKSLEERISYSLTNENVNSRSRFRLSEDDGGTKIDGISKEDVAALQAAVKAGDVQEVQRLLAANAAAASVDKSSGENALYLAVRTYYENGRTPHALDILEFIAAHPADANIRPRSGKPAIILAIDNRDVGVVRLLLAAGANPNIAASNGTSALMYAATRGMDNICRVLVEAGGDPDLANDDGLTAISGAADFGYDELSRLLRKLSGEFNR